MRPQRRETPRRPGAGTVPALERQPPRPPDLGTTPARRINASRINRRHRRGRTEPPRRPVGTPSHRTSEYLRCSLRHRQPCHPYPMKEDVLEQIVDDYLQMRGYFTTHNVRFNPPKDEHYVARDDAVPSDIDVVGLHPKRTGPDRVMVVSCKSWQSGFAAPLILAQLRGEAKNPKRRT